MFILRSLVPVALASVALLGCSAADAQTGASDKARLFEAEFPRANGDIKVEKDPDALSGKYAMHPREYEPLFVHDTPKTGNEYAVWVRCRGTAVQLKAADSAGQQTELKWSFDKPPAWTWICLGIFPRSALGSQIIVIRGPGAAANAGLDAVILAPDTDFDPSKLSAKELAALTVPAN